MIIDKYFSDKKMAASLRSGWSAVQSLPVLLLLAAVVLMLGTTTAWCGEKTATLSDSDCGKCHKQPAQDIATSGGAHADDVGCLGCHVAHPPQGEAVIPECSECHDAGESAHFALKNCDQCHSPHAPVIKDFSELGEVKTGCLSCHPQVGKAMAALPSAHSEQDCSECHQAHGLGKGQFMNCLDCHEGHNDKMTYKDCLGCHNPHTPTDYRWSEETNTKLCSACHADEVEALTKHGAAHASEIGCSDCHQNHPPATEGVIPKCGDCHDGDDNPHFKVADCSRCHNPHEPLEMDLEALAPVKTVCLSCHEEPGQEMEKYPSAHAEMDCSECHAEHGEYKKCLECHEGHSDDMTYKDCLRCHKPHQPTHLEFGAAGVAPKLCGSCHNDELGQLKANHTAHAKLQCVYCHKRTHKVILSCDDCHGQPHDSSIHQQFEECSKCHNGPHNLRN